MKFRTAHLGKALPTVCVKYLGVYVDNKLNFQYHTCHTFSKLRKWIGSLKNRATTNRSCKKNHI